MTPRNLPLALLCLALSGCDAAPAQPPPAPPPPGRFGLVRAAVTTQTLAGRTFSQSHANATFIDTDASGGGRSCDRRAAGACLLYRCAPAAGSSQVPNAGPITISGGSAPVVLPVQGDGSYDVFSHSSAALWRGGGTVSVSAPGVPGVVPAFSAEVLMPADPFALLSPVVSPILALVIERGQDLTVTYSGASGKVELLLVQDLLSGEGAYLLCSFPAGAQGGAVPASLLGALQPTQGTAHTGLLLIGPAAGKIVAAGDFAVDIAAVGVGSTAQVNLR